MKAAGTRFVHVSTTYGPCAPRVLMYCAFAFSAQGAPEIDSQLLLLCGVLGRAVTFASGNLTISSGFASEPHRPSSPQNYKDFSILQAALTNVSAAIPRRSKQTSSNLIPGHTTDKTGSRYVPKSLVLWRSLPFRT